MIVTDEQILTEIKKIIGEHKVALFMKGLPEAPRCGFSARVVVLSSYSNWPTIPQLFVAGSLVGGCDIIEELAESGELPAILGVAE